MSVNQNAKLEITAFDWVPDFARGYVRDLRPRWACEEIGLDYAEHLISAINRPAESCNASEGFASAPATLKGAELSDGPLAVISMRTGSVPVTTIPPMST